MFANNNDYAYQNLRISIFSKLEEGNVIETITDYLNGTFSVVCELRVCPLGGVFSQTCYMNDRGNMRVF